MNIITVAAVVQKVAKLMLVLRRRAVRRGACNKLPTWKSYPNRESSREPA